MHCRGQGQFRVDKHCPPLSGSSIKRLINDSRRLIAALEDPDTPLEIERYTRAGQRGGTRIRRLCVCVCVCVVWAHENSSASGDRRERGGGWYGGERLCRAASLSRTEPRRYSTWNIDGMCQCVLMNRGDTRPPGVPRFFAVRKFDCRDRMGRNGRRKRRKEKNSFPIDFYCLVIVRAQSLAASPFSFRFFEFVRDIRQYSKLLFILSSLLLFVDLIIRNFCDSGKRENWCSRSVLVFCT